MQAVLGWGPISKDLDLNSVESSTTKTQRQTAALTMEKLTVLEVDG